MSEDAVHVSEGFRSFAPAVDPGYQSLGLALERLGHSVDIVCPDDFAFVRRISGRLVPLAYPFAIASWLRRRRHDVDFVMFHSYAGWLATALNRRRAPRSLVMFHGVEPLYHRELRREAIVEGRPLSWRYRLLQERLMPLMLRVACRTADGVACLNREEAEFLRERRWTRSGRVRLLAHGVPSEFFRAAARDGGGGARCSSSANGSR